MYYFFFFPILPFVRVVPEFLHFVFTTCPQHESAAVDWLGSAAQDAGQ